MSPERLGPYVREMGDASRAVALYEWNLMVSAALFEVLGAVEVILRNALHRELEVRHLERGGTGPWYDGTWLDEKGQQDIVVARERATNRGRDPERTGKVVAELSFGFWRYLVAKRYQATAWPALQKAFPLNPDAPSVPRRDVDDRIQRIHVLRNRVAHHEPVFRRNLDHDFADMLTLVSWVSTNAHDWLADLSRVKELLAERPR